MLKLFPQSSFLLIVGLLVVLTSCRNEKEPEVYPGDIEFTEQVAFSDLSLPNDSLSVKTFEKLMAYAREKELSKRSLGEIIGTVGQWFLEEPYVAGTLDQHNEERLIIKLDGFDCVTFVESTLALSRVIKASSYEFDDFATKLVEQRYRGNVLQGYCSRLHYFSEWIRDNEEKGIVDDITRDLGGITLAKTLNFMSSNRDSYPLLAADDELYRELVEIENGLKDLEIDYIPQYQIRDSYPALETGDIIALATDIKGLDVVHTGFVFKDENGVVGLLHASTSMGVTVSPDLQEYVENNKRQIGILVARPKA